MTPTPARILTGASLVLSAWIGASPASAVAQTVRGVVLRADSGEPLAGVLIEVIGRDGTRVGGTLSGPEGRYSVASSGGTSLQASFVGMAPAFEPLGPLAATDTLFLDLELESSALELEGLSVVAEERCGGEVFEAVEIGRVWREARTALESIEWASDASLFRYDIESYVRRLDATGRRVLSESRGELSTWGTHPFRSPDASVLSADGYVQEIDGSTMYFAPDVEALLSDDFLETHCFGIERKRDDPELVGLSFRPVDGRRVPDIVGTFWLDSRTSQLVELTFRYTGLERDIDTSELGGRIEYASIDGGGWIVDAWAIRMPVVGLQPVAGRAARREVVTALEEHGGEVREVRRSGEAIGARGERGVVRGRVVREGSDEAAAGVTVRIGGTTYLTRSDATGAFALRGIPDGIYELRAYDPVLSVLGLDTVRTPVRPVPESADSTDGRFLLRIPSLESELRRRCGSLDVGLDDRGGALSGAVFDERSDVPVPDARVRASWQSVRALDETGVEGGLEWLEIVTDRTGRFAFCDLPADAEIDVLASAFGRGSPRRALRLGPGEVRHVRLEIDAGDPIALEGRVVSESGGALASAQVTVGPHAVLSDDEGRFRIGEVAPGAYPLTVQHLGRSSVGDSVHVGGGAENYVEVVVPTATFELEGLSVEVTRGARARYRTQDTRVDMMTREEIEAAAFGATSIAQVLRHANVPGLQSYEAQFEISPGNRLHTRLGICIQLGRNAGDACRMTEVYLDGVRMPRPQFDLLSIDVMTMDRIEVLSALEAQTRYPDARYGVVLLYTR